MTQVCRKPFSPAFHPVTQKGQREETVKTLRSYAEKDAYVSMHLSTHGKIDTDKNIGSPIQHAAQIHS